MFLKSEQSMTSHANVAEEFVYQVCRKSFLSLWSYANPIGKNGKELCDILIVCEPDIIIFSVKDVTPTDSGDVRIDWTRWLRSAIDESIDQIYGAERWIKSAHQVIRSDGSPGLAFPHEPERRIHRVGVALGGQGNVPIRFGEFGKGFVHVLDESSFNILLKELDTVTDFVDYLVEKENLYSSGVSTLFQGREEDLLALYLLGGRRFPDNFDNIIDLWDTSKEKDEFKAKKREDQQSYVWDRLIEILCEDILKGNLEFGSSLSDNEIAIRCMARENRLSRRMLGKSFNEFVEASGNNKIRSRIMEGLSDVAYVLLATPHSEDRQERVKELWLRCLVARGLKQDCKTVLGIATEQYQSGTGFSLDIFYLHKEAWTDNDQSAMESIRNERGYFKSPLITSVHYDEYPSN